MAASVLEIHGEFDYINREIDDIYCQYNTLRFCYVFLHFNNKYMIALTQVTNTEIFAFIPVLVFKLLSRKVLFINWKDNRNCWKVDYFLRKKEISRENYSKVVGTWNFQRTFETRKRSFISAFSVCMTAPIKHVKLIIFENYNECKTKHLFLIKQNSNTIW